MDNNAHSLSLKGLFNITTIVLWTQSPNSTPELCENNVTNNCSPHATQNAVIWAHRGVEELLGDPNRVKPVHVINHDQTSHPLVSDNGLLNYENVISHVPLLNIVADTHAHSTAIPEITSLIHGATAAAEIGTTVLATSTTPFPTPISYTPKELNNYWALLALILVIGTAAGNILVCLAITWERRLQNVTNYFLMSLAITDLMVAILVMPLGILTLFHGKCCKHHSKHNVRIAKRLSQTGTNSTWSAVSPWYLGKM